MTGILRAGGTLRSVHHARVVRLIECRAAGDPPASRTDSTNYYYLGKREGRANSILIGLYSLLTSLMHSTSKIFPTYNLCIIFHTRESRLNAGRRARAARGGRGEGRVVWPLAFSTALSRSVGRSASQSPTLVFFVYFLFYSFNLSLRPVTLKVRSIHGTDPVSFDVRCLLDRICFDSITCGIELYRFRSLQVFITHTAFTCRR